MPTHQRKRGLPVRVWKFHQVIDSRGNKHDVSGPEGAHEERAWIFSQRSARAEVPGQLAINVLRIGVSADLEDVDLWSKVEILGKLWDIAAPPSYHHGTRHTRHWSIDLRERPTDAQLQGDDPVGQDPEDGAVTDGI